jgi:predicted lipid-binding transport protein (Tim44 family)
LATAGAPSGGNSASSRFDSEPNQYGSVGQLNTPNQYRMGAENNSAFGNAQSSVLSVSGTPIQSLPLQLPAGFDPKGFLNVAKQVFIKVQAAFDASDVNALREFASDDVLAELQRQIQERGAQPNKTNVVTINAELLGFETDGDEHLASVHFSGTICEHEGAAAEPFEDVWNLSRPVNGRGGWVLAGMQSL